MTFRRLTFHYASNLYLVILIFARGITLVVVTVVVGDHLAFVIAAVVRRIRSWTMVELRMSSNYSSIRWRTSSCLSSSSSSISLSSAQTMKCSSSGLKPPPAVSKSSSSGGGKYSSKVGSEENTQTFGTFAVCLPFPARPAGFVARFVPLATKRQQLESFRLRLRRIPSVWIQA